MAGYLHDASFSENIIDYSYFWKAIELAFAKPAFAISFCVYNICIMFF